MRHDVMSILHAFCMIAENHSFTRAAAQLHISTSALSQNMRQLEDELGVKLLNRTTRRVGLTEAGHAFLASIRPALNHIDEAMNMPARAAIYPEGHYALRYRARRLRFCYNLISPVSCAIIPIFGWIST